MRAAEVKRGNVIEHDGRVWQVRGVERSAAQGRGGNVTFRFTLYSVPGGQKFDLSLRSDDDVREVELLRRAANFSYMDGDAFVFMDNEDFTPYTLDAAALGDDADFVVEGVDGYFVQIIDDTAVGLQIPQSVTLEVVETAPEMKGATATKRAKPAKLANGIEVLVPEYIGNGEKIIINTASREFSGRA
ncbi:MAG: elongation factor P-like protein YeiP [Xanthomonadales bacterium]|nr:elongation factor P-like protein YeiP [Xanthomonadales bacterium]